MTRPFQRVIVGHDGSDAADDALELALRLVDSKHGELVLAHVDANRAVRFRHANRRPAADVLAEAMAAVPADRRARAIARSAGSVPRRLCEIAEQQRADLLVLGSHRGGGEGRTTPGATALRLLQGSPCAVAIAPRGLRDRERFHHIGVAFDGSDESRHALELAYALAAREFAAVTIYRALSPTGVVYAGAAAQEIDAATQVRRRTVEEELDAAADSAPPGVNPRTVLVHDEPSGILRACGGIVDLLVIGSRGYGPVHRALAGSVSLPLLLDATQPVVVVPRAGIARAG